MTYSNIIVRMPNWVGDLIMATPIIKDLRQAFPEAKITVMVRRPLQELLEKSEDIDEIFSFHKPDNPFLRRRQRRNLIEKIRLGKYDLGLLLTNSFSSAWCFYQGNIKEIVGYKCHWRSLLLTKRVPYPDKGHQIDIYKKLLEPLGISHSDTQPYLTLEKKEVDEARKIIEQRGYKRGKPLIGIHPCSAYGMAKCWPKEYFQKLAKELLKEEDLFLLFFGQQGDDEIIKEICEVLPSRAMNLAGVTTLTELACLIELSDILVTNDSGPMHIACALKKPLIALFGSTDPEKTGPYTEDAKMIKKDLPCSPCHLRKCPIDFPCMRSISVEEVLEQIKDVQQTHTKNRS